MIKKKTFSSTCSVLFRLLLSVKESVSMGLLKCLKEIVQTLGEVTVVNQGLLPKVAASFH